MIRINLIGKKKCSHCGMSKDMVLFDKNRANLDGLCGACRICRYEYEKHRRIVAKELNLCKRCRKSLDRIGSYCTECLEKDLYQQKQYRDKMKSLAIKAYGGYICASCGETEPLFLCLDHINGGGRKQMRDLHGNGINLYRWLAENGYPTGFMQVLCYNCNIKKSVVHTKSKYRIKLKNLVFRAYGGYICNCCKVIDPDVLCIDHINGGGEKHRREMKNSSSIRTYKWLRDNNYPDGFQVLCHNCNSGRELNGRICPHKSISSYYLGLINYCSMPTKTPLFNGYGPGFWGGNPHARILAEHTVEKVTQQNIEKLQSMGLPYAVWHDASAIWSNLVSVNPSLPSTPPLCSCFKDTSKQPDLPCYTCGGTGYIPGWLKFGTQNYWKSSIDTDWALTNLTLDTVNRPNRLQLNPASTSGTAVSPQITISTINKVGAWESKLNGFTRDGGANSSIIAEYSIDNGVTWISLSSLNLAPPTTVIKFRITMSRTSTTVKSPMFEIVRIRYPTMLDTLRGELTEPVVRFIPTWDVQQEIRQAYGERIDSSNKVFWTVPLTVFDVTLGRETQLARLEPDTAFVECRYGGNIGFRYAMTNFSYSDTFSQFTRQSFGLRQYSGMPGQTSGEFAYLVF